MADVKWIKIVTTMFEDEKIKYIETMPNADAIITIWVKLLCLAGKSAHGGFLMLTDDLPYTTQMLAASFNRDVKRVKNAIEVFEQLGMVEWIENRLCIVNWSRHQSIDKIEKKKAYDREYQKAKRHETQTTEKQESNDNSYDNRTIVVRDDNDNRSAEIDKELDIEIDKEKIDKKEKPTRHQYGQYKNVLLSDGDMDKLRAEYPTDWQTRIERLSEYMASTGKTYKNHLATIRAWARKDKDRSPTAGSAKKPDDGLDDLLAQMYQRGWE